MNDSKPLNIKLNCHLLSLLSSTYGVESMAAIMHHAMSFITLRLIPPFRRRTIPSRQERRRPHLDRLLLGNRQTVGSIRHSSHKTAMSNKPIKRQEKVLCALCTSLPPSSVFKAKVSIDLFVNKPTALNYWDTRRQKLMVPSEWLLKQVANSIALAATTDMCAFIWPTEARRSAVFVVSRLCLDMQLIRAPPILSI